MLPVPKTAVPPPPVKRLSVKNWLNGTVTAFDDGRTPLDGLKSSGNVYLQQDGTVRPRPSLVRYGPQPMGKVLGEIFEFKKVTGLTTENWMICMQSFNVSPSSSVSPSASASPSASQSMSPSSSQSRSPSSSVSPSHSTSQSPSSSASPSASLSNSPSSSVSASPSAPSIGFAQIFIARGEDTSWTACTGKYYDDLAKAHFFQIADKIVIMNGVDTLSYLTIATSIITPFTALSTPAAPTLNTDGTLGSGFPVTYRVTANSTVGETAASSALTVDTALDRDSWSGTNTVTINLPTVSGATSYNIYAGTVAGSEYLIATGIAFGTATFVDTGGTTMPQDFTRKFPTTNSTAGPKVSRGTNIGGRAFLVGDKDNPYLVWFGGDIGFELDFTPVNGGGNQLIGQGSKDLPIAVKSFRDGKGNAQITVLCQGTNGRGKRFLMTADSASFGGATITFYDVTEDNGQDGTDSPDGVIFYNDSLWYPSRDGFKTTGTKPQLQNVLTTDRVSNTIQPDLKLLNSSAMGGCVGLGFEGRLHWALPVSGSSNNEIWVLDLERKGAWMKPWSISCDWMWLYNGNTTDTHQLVLSNNVIYDLSYSALTTDNGVAFQTNGESGQIYFSEDKRMWAKLLQVIFVVLRPQGQISFQVTGKTEDAALQALGEPTTFTATTDTTVAGWGEVNRLITGWGRNRWSKVLLVPTSITDATQEVIIEVDEECQWAAYGWNSSGVGVDYNLSDVIYEFIEIGIRDLS